MKALCLFALAVTLVVLIGCNHEPAPSTKSDEPSCSERVLPLGLKFGMSHDAVDSQISDGTLIPYKGADSLENYKAAHAGHTFYFSFHNDKLISFVVNYRDAVTFNVAFLEIRRTIALYRLPGGDGMKTYFPQYGMIPQVVDLLPNTLPKLPDQSYNDAFFGSICDGLLVVTERFGDWGRIWYTSTAPQENLSPEFELPFQRANSYVTSIYRQFVPTGYYVPKERDY